MTGPRGRRAGRLFREALDASPTPTLLTSRALTLLHVNPAAEELLMLSAARAVLRPLRTVPQLGLSLVGLAGTALAQAGTVRAELSLPQRGTVAVAVAPVLRPGGVRALVIELRQKEARLDLAELAAGLAHEIRNPLAGLKGAAELLRDELGEGSPLSDYPRVIATEAARLEGLMRSLLDLTRPLALRPALQNVHPICDDVLLLSKGLVPAGVTLLRRYDPSLPELEVDREPLLQVLLNLVKNAIEAVTPGGGTVTVETGTAPGQRVRVGGRVRKLVRISVLDTGPGLPVGRELFTPFSTTKPQGTGLGLVVARRIVEAHGGRLTLVDRREGGAEAQLLLPG